MNCAESEQFFDAYLDGELSGSLRLEFDAHRLRCPVCQQKLAMMEACEHILARDARMPEVSEDFTDRVMDQIGQRRLIAQRSRRRRLVIGATVALQAAAVLVFAVLWSGHRSSTRDPILDGATAELRERVGDALAKDDKAESKVEIVELMYAYGDVLRERLLAAGSKFEQDASGLVGYASSLSILGELPPASETAAPSFWEVFVPSPLPTSPEESEPPAGAAGSFSL